MTNRLCVSLHHVHYFLALLVLPILSFAESRSPQPIGEGYCNVLFWPNKNLGFGHAALEVFRPGNHSEKPDVYISWARRNNKKTDMKFHKRNPKIIKLGGISTQQYNRFEEWFDDSIFISSWHQYGKEYHTLKNNCAHAVVHGLRALGLSRKKKPNRFGLRPKDVYRGVKKIRSSSR